MTWAVRRRNLSRIFGGGVADELPARGRLGSDLRNLVESGRLTVVAGFAAEHIDRRRDGVVVMGRCCEHGIALNAMDHIIVATGQRPDLAMTRELRLDLDPWLECARALGPLIDPNLHSCGTVPPHGYEELSHPEPDYYAAGIKSYGRAPTFLRATGYEQVRSIAAHLAGDVAAANDIRLVLPETGVCSTHLMAEDDTRGGCCGSQHSAPVDRCRKDDAGAECGGYARAGSAAATAIKSCCGVARDSAQHSDRTAAL
jgi:hypothetical protein